MQIKVSKIPKSEVEIEGELGADIFENYYASALKKIGESLELPGFRKGKAPENVIISKVGEMSVLEEMAQMALGEYYPKILEEHKIDAVGRPEISITKIARRNPLGFKIKTAVLPAFKLPDYKKIAKKVLSSITDSEKNIVVTEEDVENTIADIRKSRAAKVHMAEHAHKEDKKHDHSHEPELPEFNDEFVKTLGPFKDTADFKEKLKINLKLEKENAQKERTRIKIIDTVIDETEIEIPDILIQAEIEKILYRMESDIVAMGLKFEDYLKHLGKTKEDLKKEFQKDGEKKSKLSLVLHEIAKTEKIAPDPKELEKEVMLILEHYKDADPERARMHAENVLTNERIFQFLESQ